MESQEQEVTGQPREEPRQRRRVMFSGLYDLIMEPARIPASAKLPLRKGSETDNNMKSKKDSSTAAMQAMRDDVEGKVEHMDTSFGRLSQLLGLSLARATSRIRRRPTFPQQHQSTLTITSRSRPGDVSPAKVPAKSESKTSVTVPTSKAQNMLPERTGLLASPSLKRLREQ